MMVFSRRKSEKKAEMKIIKSVDARRSFIIAPGGFEPPSAGPEPAMLDRYTTGLYIINKKS